MMAPAAKRSVPAATAGPVPDPVKAKAARVTVRVA
jgi:hypothetical protein